MMGNKRRLTWAFLALSCILLLPTLVFGLREAHDIKFHLTLFLSYRDAVQLGTLYPRWLPDQLQGLGSPALLIYPPLASAFFVLVDFATLHALTPARVLGLGALLLALASCATFYAWARAHVGARLALVAALFYATAPYHLNIDLYERGALAEYTAFVWLPLIFLGVRTTLLLGNVAGVLLLALCAGALFLTHLLTAMLVAPLALAYALACLRTHLPADLRLRRFGLVALAALLGVGLAAFYFLPALALLPEANASALHNDVATSNLLLALRVPFDRFQVKLFLLGSAYLACFLYLAAHGWRNWRNRRNLHTTNTAQAQERAPRVKNLAALVWIGCGVLCFALMAGLFPFVFRPPSPYAQVQFLWRLLGIMEFALVSLFVCSVEATRQAARRAQLVKTGAGVLLLIIAAQGLDVVARFHNVAVFADPLAALDQVRRRLAPIEYFPVGTKPGQPVATAFAPYERYASASVPAFGTSATVRIADATRAGARVTVHSVASAAAPVLIQQFYFPGWKAVDEQGRAIAVVRDDASRLASYLAPAGEHTVVVARTATRQERWGSRISLVSLGLLVLLVLALARRRAATVALTETQLSRV